MKYLTGEKIELGDNIKIEKGRTDGIVYAVLESDSDLKSWNVKKQGLIIESKPFGLVFYPISEENDPVVFSVDRNSDFAV